MTSLDKNQIKIKKNKKKAINFSFIPFRRSKTSEISKFRISLNDEEKINFLHDLRSLNFQLLGNERYE